MAEWKGFWSYVHADDEAECGRISQLARDVAAQFEMQTCERIELFLDRDSIQWGEDWHSKIDEWLDSVAFFIAVITPRYFRSPECRRELQSFARKAKSRGISDLILPLLYVDVPALHEEEPNDDLIDIVRSFQWADWQVLRFEEICSGVYRRAVSDLSMRLVAANDRTVVAVRDAVSTSPFDVVTEGSEEAGTLDKMAESEIAMGEWIQNVQQITKDVEQVGALMDRAFQDVVVADATHGSFSARLAVIENLARDLQEPADRILVRSNDFTSQLHRVDDGLRLIIELIPQEVGNDESLRPQACEFFDIVRNLSNSVHTALESTNMMLKNSRQIERFSRELRGPLRQINQGLTTIIEGCKVSDDWIRLIEETGLDCSSVSG